MLTVAPAAAVFSSKVYLSILNLKFLAFFKTVVLAETVYMYGSTISTLFTICTDLVKDLQPPRFVLSRIAELSLPQYLERLGQGISAHKNLEVNGCLGCSLTGLRANPVA